MTRAISLPSPVGGWNARDALADMEATDAVSMINMIPRAGYVESRRGSVMHCDMSLLPFSTYAGSLFASSTRLYAARSGNIVDVTTSTPVNVYLSGSINAIAWQTTGFRNLTICTCAEATASGDVGIALDDTGVATPLVVTAPGLSGPFWGCNTFKGRAFYWQKDARSFWYAQAGSYQGTLTEFDLSTQIRTGGTLVMMLTWTIDAGDGVDDLAVFLFSTGETIVYQGDDPGNAQKWRSNGRFQIGEPLGIRAHAKVGGTEIILTKDGYIDLGAALADGRYSEKSTYSNKIIRAAKEMAQKSGHLFGWECLLYPAGNMFIVNVPTSEPKFFGPYDEPGYTAIEAVQHVRNTSTGSWCMFNGWDATAFCVYQDNLYFLRGDKIMRADAGASDSGASIAIECVPAFQSLGTKARRKQITAASHVTNFSQPGYLVKDGMADYNIRFGNYVPISPYQGVKAKWNLSKWNVSKWEIGGSELQSTTESWTNVSAVGYAVTVSLRAQIIGAPFFWYSTNIMFRHLGVL